MNSSSSSGVEINTKLMGVHECLRFSSCLGGKSEDFSSPCHSYRPFFKLIYIFDFQSNFQYILGCIMLFCLGHFLKFLIGPFLSEHFLTKFVGRHKKGVSNKNNESRSIMGFSSQGTLHIIMKYCIIIT